MRTRIGATWFTLARWRLPFALHRHLSVSTAEEQQSAEFGVGCLLAKELGSSCDVSAAANECVDAVDPSSGNRFPGCERHSLFALWADTFRSAGPCVDRGRDGRAAEVHAPTGSGGQDGKPPGQALKCWALRLGATSRVPPAPSTEIYKHIAVRQVLPLSLPETNPTHAGRAACSSGSGGPHRRPSL
jgi:hypothetical protein